MKKKHGEFILAIDDQFFENHSVMKLGVTRYDTDTFFDEVQSHLVIRERAHLECNPNYRQIIPYTLIRKIEPNRPPSYFTYRRGKGVGEQRLLGT